MADSFDKSMLKARMAEQNILAWSKVVGNPKKHFPTIERELLFAEREVRRHLAAAARTDADAFLALYADSPAGLATAKDLVEAIAEGVHPDRCIDLAPNAPSWKDN